ncbi:MAG: 6-bladed beta-propeller [Gemmatimonadetes bacterium]|nr:6-bladed beta-propeller [Gemmatimonadota bacterium]
MGNCISRAWASPLAVIWSACGGPTDRAPSPGITVTLDTLNGIEIVRSEGETAGGSFEMVVTLGSSGGLATPAADEFAWVSSVALGPDRLLYVADLEHDYIAVFDTSGVLVRTLGREGNGPGEFQSVYSIAFVGDTLLTLDIGAGRIGRFAGERWHGYEPAVGRLTASPVEYRLYAVGPRETYQWAYRAADDLFQPTWRGHGRATGVEWRRTAPAIETPFPDKVVCTLGRGFSWFDHPRVPRALAHPAPGASVYLAATDRYRIAHVRSDGDTIRVIERDVAPPLLVDAEWQAIEARFTAWLEGKDVRQCEPRALTRPATKPAIESLQVDVAGRLWVERNLEQGTRWEIFDEQGRLTGSLPGFDHDRQRSVPWLGPDHIAWITRDSLDIPFVHLARVHLTGAQSPVSR